MAGCSRGASSLGDLVEDFSVRETTSCSLLRLTIRWDMFRTMVPARCKVALAVFTDKERCKEPDLRMSLLGDRNPASAWTRSSPSLALDGLAGMLLKRTLCL